MLVGLTAEAEFKPEALEMPANGILFVYSDVVTEAKNSKGNLYSEEKLLKMLNQADRGSAPSIIKYIEDDIAAFSEKAEQYDDITMLCVKRL